VSLNIYKDDVEKYGAKALDLERYRAQAKIRFNEHFPELMREFNDVWAVLNFLAFPPKTVEDQKYMESWRPLSANGWKMGLFYHVAEKRLIPNICRHCGMCPAQSQCQEDNPEDWQEYWRKQKFGNIVENENIIPEDWLDPFEKLDQPLVEIKKADSDNIQMSFFDNLPEKKTKSPLKNHNLKAKEWKELGFFTAKEWLAILRKMHEIIPVHNGTICPCKKTQRIPAFFLEEARKFFEERENHKQAQEAEGKTRSGKGEDKVKDLFDSEVIRELLKNCPVEGCPFAKKTEPV
jgi:hypothetical protein